MKRLKYSVTYMMYRQLLSAFAKTLKQWRLVALYSPKQICLPLNINIYSI